MRSSELLSKEWCDVVFENRNHEYGAYQLRKQTGKRYRAALLCIFGGLLLILLSLAGTALYLRHRILQSVEEAQQALNELRRSELKQGYKVKFIATARMIPPVRQHAIGNTETIPKIVDADIPSAIVGKKSDFVFNPDEDVILTPILDTVSVTDKNQPIARDKIIPTEVVSQLPEFPGGARSFMKWLNEHIAYPHQCIKRQQQGEVMLSFIVDTDGYATDLKVENAFDVEVYRAILNAFKRMPKWKPGTDELGRITPVKISVPVKFQL